MDVPEDLDEETILRLVQTWPREQQVELAHRILDPGLATLDPLTGRPYIASAELRGIARGDGPVPTDEDIARWRDEKYGNEA
jgi:CRISPR/Cas system CMR subunit Cmr6 (Cas7 group RAMP superfamily)